MPTAQPTILIVTANEGLARSLDKQLRTHSYDVQLRRTAADALAQFRRHPPSLVLADRTDPALDPLRKMANTDAVPFLTLQPPGQPCREDDCLIDLQEGSDAVLCTESYREILARVRAVLRRERFQAVRPSRYQVGAIQLDLDRHEVTVWGRLVELTPKEFEILRRLMEAPDHVFSRQELLNRVWGEDWALEEHTLDVHIYSLRQKIEPDSARPSHILTVRGVGYKLQSRQDGEPTRPRS